MIALVTIMFGVTWAPIHCIHFAMKILKDFPFENQNLFALKCFTHTLTYLNSMLNPFMYTIMGNNFRKQAFAQKNRLKSYYTSRKSSNFPHSKAKSIRSKLNSTDGNNETFVLNSLILEKDFKKEEIVKKSNKRSDKEKLTKQISTRTTLD